MDETQTDGGDDFYEKIEAPKFVDLTAPDHHRPDNDDRYWFCLRVGPSSHILFLTVDFFFLIFVNLIASVMQFIG